MLLRLALSCVVLVGAVEAAEQTAGGPECAAAVNKYRALAGASPLGLCDDGDVYVCVSVSVYTRKCHQNKVFTCTCTHTCACAHMPLHK